MSYIGIPPQANFSSGLLDRFTSTTGTTVTLTHDIASENDIVVFVNFVKQDSTTYSVGGTGNKTLTLGGTLVSSDIVEVHYLNIVGQTNAPSSGSVTTATINDNAVTGAKLNTDVISAQTELATAPASTDELLISDAGTLKRIDASLVVGNTKQIVTTQTGAVATGTTLFPEDDTIPQNTEGDQYMSLAITPKSSTSRLLITAQVFGSVSSGTRWGIGLFKDSTADALSFATAFVKDATSMATCYIEHSLLSGSTSEQTFKIRAGAFGSATFTFNGQSGSRKFGGAILSSIHITEIEP